MVTVTVVAMAVVRLSNGDESLDPITQDCQTGTCTCGAAEAVAVWRATCKVSQGHWGLETGRPTLSGREARKGISRQNSSEGEEAKESKYYNTGSSANCLEKFNTTKERNYAFHCCCRAV